MTQKAKEGERREAELIKGVEGLSQKKKKANRELIGSEKL